MLCIRAYRQIVSFKYPLTQSDLQLGSRRQQDSSLLSPPPHNVLLRCMPSKQIATGKDSTINLLSLIDNYAELQSHSMLPVALPRWFSGYPRGLIDT